jgi:hypothetical protein
LEPALNASLPAAAIEGALPLGYEQRGHVLVPKEFKPVPANKLYDGLQAAKPQIRRMVEEMADVFAADYQVKEIELTASFSAEGKFIGFGVGGEASIKITIAPSSKDKAR